MALQWASEELRGDRKVVMTAIANYGDALEWASEELRGDREIVMTALSEETSECAFMYASSELRGDKEVAMKAVGKCETLQLASSELRGDKDIVLKAVGVDGGALEDASEELYGDKDIVMAALRLSPEAFELHASHEVRGDKTVALAAVTASPYNLRVASEELRGDKDVVMAAVEKDFEIALPFASNKIELFSDLKFTAQIIRCIRRDAGSSLVDVLFDPDQLPQNVAGNLRKLLGDTLDALSDWNSVDVTVSPEVFAERCLVRLTETQWCISEGLPSVAVHVAEFCGIEKHYQLARDLKAWAPVVRDVLWCFGPECPWFEMAQRFLDWYDKFHMMKATHSSR